MSIKVLAGSLWTITCNADNCEVVWPGGERKRLALEEVTTKACWEWRGSLHFCPVHAQPRPQPLTPEQENDVAALLHLAATAEFPKDKLVVGTTEPAKPILEPAALLAAGAPPLTDEERREFEKFARATMTPPPKKPAKGKR